MISERSKRNEWQRHNNNTGRKRCCNSGDSVNRVSSASNADSDPSHGGRARSSANNRSNSSARASDSARSATTNDSVESTISRRIVSHHRDELALSSQGFQSANSDGKLDPLMDCRNSSIPCDVSSPLPEPSFEYMEFSDSTIIDRSNSWRGTNRSSANSASAFCRR